MGRRVGARWAWVLDVWGLRLGGWGLIPVLAAAADPPPLAPPPGHPPARLPRAGGERRRARLPPADHL